MRAKSTLAASSLITRLAVIVRDQANTIIRLRLTDSPSVRLSGEGWLVATAGPKCRTFVDVGANRGEWTSMILSSGGYEKRGVLFEPSRSALEVLTSRFSQHSSVTIVPAAVSDVSGSTHFYEEPNAGGTSSCVPGYSRDGSIVRDVPVTTIDAEVDKHGLSTIDFLKVDAEGFDYNVLRGASRTLRAGRVGLIQFEYNQSWIGAGSTLRAAVEFLDAAHMSVFLLNRRGLYRPRLTAYGEYFGLSNYVAVSPNWMRLLDRFIRGVI